MSVDINRRYGYWQPSLIHEYAQQGRMNVDWHQYLRLWMPFNEGSGTPRDHSGRNNHPSGVYHGTWVSSPFGWCMEFDGSDATSGLIFTDDTFPIVTNTSNNTVIWWIRVRIGAEGNMAGLRTTHIHVLNTTGGSQNYYMTSQTDGDMAFGCYNGVTTSNFVPDICKDEGEWIDVIWGLDTSTLWTIFASEEAQGECLGAAKAVPNNMTLVDTRIGTDGGFTYGPFAIAGLACWNIPYIFTSFRTAQYASNPGIATWSRILSSLG